MSPVVTAYVDGACCPNPGRGGWGAVLRHNLSPGLAVEKRLSGCVPEHPSTNQRAELYAALYALSALTAPCVVRIVSDSRYLVSTMNGEYRRRTNLDLWERLDGAALPHEVEWCWVRGHSGERGNDLAHELAEEAATTNTLPEIEICPPRTYDDCPVCDEPHTYQCGRTLLLRNVENQEERCPDGTMICDDCGDIGEEFFEEAYNARARDKEQEVDG